MLNLKAERLASAARMSVAEVQRVYKCSVERFKRAACSRRALHTGRLPMPMAIVCTPPVRGYASTSQAVVLLEAAGQRGAIICEA